MADFQNAGYRLLSFKYTPPSIETKRAAEKDKDIDYETGTGVEAGDLPSLSSLLAPLEEIQSLSNDKKDIDGPGEEMSGKSNDSTKSGSIAKPLTHFHLFDDLPTEIRLKIWDLTFLPRVVEVRPPRPAFDFKGQWQSGCSNPAQLSVSIEARKAALARYRIPFLLTTTIARNEQQSSGNSIRHGDDVVKPVPYKPQPIRNLAFVLHGLAPCDDSGREVRRTLYISPEHDTVCCLGKEWDPVLISSVMGTLREADPLGLGIRRLGTSIRAWGLGTSAAVMNEVGKMLFSELDEFTLFLYGEQYPPRTWWARGWAMVDGDEREQFRREGNCCVLKPCESESSAWAAYKIWFAGSGRGFWNGGNVLRVGRNNNEIQFMDLEFKAGW